MENRLITKRHSLTGSKKKTTTTTLRLLFTAALVAAWQWAAFAQVSNTYGTGHLGGSTSGNKGSYNIHIGRYVGGYTEGGNYNVFVGEQAGSENVNGNYNVFIGHEAGFGNSDGGYNVSMGYGAGYYNESGSNNIFLGHNAGYNETGSNKLYIDNSNTSTPLIYGDFENDILRFNGNVGIGTSPAHSLHVKSGTNEFFYRSAAGADHKLEMVAWNNGVNINNTKDGGHLYLNRDAGSSSDLYLGRSGRETFIDGATGNVGIGKTNPSHKLDVNGTINATGILVNGSPISGGSSLWTANGSNAYYSGGNIGVGTNNPQIHLAIGDSDTGLKQQGDGQLAIFTNNAERLRVNNSGNVGIGKTNPSHKLDVNGTINATGILVNGNSLNGNFGQWKGHGTYRDFNTPVTDWGWSYVQGNTNAPNTTSSQWYRFAGSLGSEYGIDQYRLELAFPRSNQGSAGVWMRTMEGGSLQPWVQVGGGGSGLWTANGSNAYYSGGNIGVGTNNPQIHLAIGDSDTGLKQQGDGQLAIFTNNAERLRVNNSGNIGIGTSSPSQKLDVAGTVKATAFVGDGSGLTNLPSVGGLWTASGSNISYSGGSVSIVNSNSDALTIKTTNNTLPQNIVFQNSGGYYTWSLGRESVGGSEADFVISGGNTSSNVNSLNEGLRISKDGNVGIGTTSPEGKFQIGDRWAFHERSGARVLGYNLAYTRGGAASTGTKIVDAGVSKMTFNDNGSIDFKTGSGIVGGMIRWTNLLSLKEDGKVGIGTTQPGSYKLAVEGKIGTHGLDVRIDGWSDFVFEEDYDLKSPEEVGAYIEAHGHLPDVPSEAEIMEEGHVDVSKMLQLQMQKIEELTLYVIEQNEKLKAQQAEIEALKKSHKK